MLNINRPITTARHKLKHQKQLLGVWQQRTLHLHEYQAAQVVHKYMVPIPKGHVAFNAHEAFNVARSFGLDYARKFVVKAQVKVEGRTGGIFKESGFEGGIHATENISEVRTISDKMLGKKYVSDLTGADGYIVNCVYIQEQLQIDKELFLQISVDTHTQ